MKRSTIEKKVSHLRIICLQLGTKLHINWRFVQQNIISTKSSFFISVKVSYGRIFIMKMSTTNKKLSHLRIICLQLGTKLHIIWRFVQQNIISTISS